MVVWVSDTCEQCGCVKTEVFGSGRFCSRKCSCKFSSNIRRRERNEKISLSLTTPDIYDICEYCGATFKQKYKRSQKAKCCSRKCAGKLKFTDERRILYSEKAKKREFGGHTSKHRLHYVMKDGSIVHLQSSYEIKMALLLDELDLTWSRPLPLIWQDSCQQQHRYYPDFEVNGVFFDTKNDYLILKDAEKIAAVMKQNNVTIHVLSLEQIEKHLILRLLQQNN